MKVLLVCSGGMSSSMLVRSMENEAKKREIPLSIESTGSDGIEDKISSFDVLLVAPQVRHRFERLSGAAAKAGIPAAVIDRQDYGLMRGDAVLDQVEELLNNHTEG